MSMGMGFVWVWVRVEVEWPMGYPWRALFSGTFEELTECQGEIALVLKCNSIDESVTIISAAELGEDLSKTEKEIQNWKLAFQYVLASDLPEDSGKLEMEQRRMCRAHTKISGPVQVPGLIPAQGSA